MNLATCNSISMPFPLNACQLPQGQLSYDDLLSHFPLPSWIIRSGSFEIVATNQPAATLYQFSHEEWSSKNFLELFSEQGKVVFFHKAAELLPGKTLEHTTKHFKKDRSGIIVRIQLRFLANTENKFFFATVIPAQDEKMYSTHQHFPDQNDLQSEQFYRTLIANSLDGMILVNAEGTITFASASVKNVLGYVSEEIIGKSAFEFVHHDDFEWAFESFQREIVENPEVKFIVVRLLKKNGEWLWCMVRGHNLLSTAHISSLVIYFHDDTLRKEASDALKESEKRFRSMIRDLQIGVFLLDKAGKIILCNKALSTMFSVSEEAITGKHIYEVISPNIIDENGEYLPLENRPLMGTILSKQSVKDVVIGVFHSDSQERFWIMVNADPILDENGEIRHVVCSVLDLTERKKLEMRLVEEQVARQKQITQATIEGQEAERREMGKELHDNIGQQLTTIKLFLDLAKSTADEPTSEMVSMALKGVSDVINEVRAMSRSLVPSTLQDIGLVESIQELAESFSRTLSTDIQFSCDEFDEENLPDNYQLTLYRIVQEQLNNIAKYADAKNVNIELMSNVLNTILKIKDDGRGFNINTLKKGLGLVNIRNRAEMLGGKMEIETFPGRGCLLKVTLPNVKIADADRNVAVD